jgi:hypothetical protein
VIVELASTMSKKKKERANGPFFLFLGFLFLLTAALAVSARQANDCYHSYHCQTGYQRVFDARINTEKLRSIIYGASCSPIYCGGDC